MVKFKIDKGVPMPLKGRSDKPNKAQEIRNVLIKLNVGDSFVITKKYVNGYHNARKNDKNIMAMKFRSFKEGEGRRIFRIN